MGMLCLWLPGGLAEAVSQLRNPLAVGVVTQPLRVFVMFKVQGRVSRQASSETSGVPTSH